MLPGRRGYSFPVLSQARTGMQPRSARHSGSLSSESFSWFLRCHRTSGACRRTLPQELGARPIQSSKVKAGLDSWDGLRLISCFAGVRPLSTKSGFRFDDRLLGSKCCKQGLHHLMYRKNKNPFPAEKLVEQESLLGVASVEW